MVDTRDGKRVRGIVDQGYKIPIRRNTAKKLKNNETECVSGTGTHAHAHTHAPKNKNSTTSS